MTVLRDTVSGMGKIAFPKGTCLVATALIAGCGAVEERPVEPADPVETAGAAVVEAPLLFGMRLGATLEEVRAALPALELVPTEDSGLQVGEGQIDVEGHEARLRIQLVDGRLFSLQFWLGGGGVGIPLFERLGASLSEVLGVALTERCVSEDGTPFEQFLADGWGSLEFSWEGDQAQGHIGLGHGNPHSGPSIEVRFEHPPLLEDYRRLLSSDLDLVKSQTKEESPSCEVRLDGAEPASFLGLSFGSSAEQIVAEVGGEYRHGHLFLDRDVAGVPAQVVLNFYSGCLATVQLLVHRAESREEDYRSIQTVAREAMPQGIARRCEGEVAGGGQELMLDTLWPDTSPLRGHLTLGWTPDDSIALEVIYLPLRPHAPQIDF